MKYILICLVVLIQIPFARADEFLSKATAYLRGVCPDVVGVSIRDPNDKSTWQISYEGTHNCQAAVQAALPNFDPNAVKLPAPISKAAFIARFTPAELTAIATTAQTNAGINVWLITAQAHDVIDLNDPLTKQGMDALVSVGLITAARETAILTP